MAKQAAEEIEKQSELESDEGNNVPVHFNIPGLHLGELFTQNVITGPAQTGFHECGRKSFGHSLIISPWGEILADAGRNICLINKIIDLNDVKRARLAIPSLKSKINFSTNF